MSHGSSPRATRSRSASRAPGAAAASWSARSSGSSPRARSSRKRASSRAPRAFSRRSPRTASGSGSRRSTSRPVPSGPPPSTVGPRRATSSSGSRRASSSSRRICPTQSPSRAATGARGRPRRSRSRQPSPATSRESPAARRAGRSRTSTPRIAGGPRISARPRRTRRRASSSSTRPRAGISSSSRHSPASGAARSSGSSTRPPRRWGRGGSASGSSTRCSTRGPSASASMPSRSSWTVSSSGRRSASRSAASAISNGSRRASARARRVRATSLTCTSRSGGSPRRGRRSRTRTPSSCRPAALVDAPPPHTRLPGFIRPGRDREVDELREMARDAKGWLARFEATERARTGVATLQVRHNKLFGYYVEVTRPNLPLVPPDYERRQTLVGAERFVTPTLRDHEARVLGAEDRLRALEVHLFEALLDGVAAHHPTLARTADALAVLDALVALAEVAHRHGYVRPVISRAPALAIRGGRHPVVEAVGGGAFVPNDARLDPDAEQILVVTGPNMGGKSTYLRQVALIVLLAHVGSFVPAAEAEIGPIDQIFTRIGAADDLAGGR